jgi:serine/threonine-protein kinase
MPEPTPASPGNDHNHVSGARPAHEDSDATVDRPAEAPTGAGTPTTAGLRFRIVRPHARGSLGAVFVAHDQELDRQVALKEIQQRHADDPGSRARFLLEAEITGGLEHPGIVPVYGLGHYPDGRPFYAMRFIKGDSLQEAIQRFHRGDDTGRDPGERALALRQLLGRFVDVCNAVAYAHSRGVLHRDLKPGNIMLGKYGETLVVDWGLAKAVGRTEPDADGQEAALRPRSGSGVTATQAGAVVGTPAYMSPEQAAGRLDRLGPASDIYGLGATLYTLLTGRAPVRGKHAGEVLEKVRRGEVVPLRRLRADIPAALEAICLRAMALKPKNRYATALDLAADVEHWLADEPVAAYPEPWTTRARRWARRHRPLVAGVAAAALVAVLLGGAGWWWLEQQAAEQREEAARREERTRLAVETALEQGRALQRGARWAEAETILAQARAGLGEEGMDNLRQRLEQAQNNLRLVKELESIRLEKANLVDGKWNPAQAGPAYAAVFRGHGLDVLASDEVAAARRIAASPIKEQLVAALEDWAAEAPDDNTRARLLAVAQEADPDRAPFRDPAAWRSLFRLQRLAARPAVQRLSPVLLGIVANRLKALGGDHVSLLREAQRQHPADFWLNFEMGRALYFRRGRYGEAIGYYRAALAVRPQTSAVYTNLGLALKDQGDLDGAIAAWRQAVALDPNNAFAHTNLGNGLYAKGDLAGAIAAFRQAIARDRGLAPAYSHLAFVLYARGDKVAALAALREAIALFRQAIAQDPNDSKAQYNLAQALGLKGMIEGNLAEAEAAVRHAIALDPKNARPQYQLGIILRSRGDLDGAMAALHQAIALDPKYADAHGALGEILLKQGRFVEGCQAAQRALELLPADHPLHHTASRQLQAGQKLLELDGRLSAVLEGKAQPASPDEQLHLAFLCYQYKQYYAAAGRFYAAAFSADPRLAKNLVLRHRYQAACAAARAATGQGQDAGKLPDKERAGLRRQALIWLQEDLAAWTELAQRGPAQARAALQQTLQRWQQAPDLAGIRDEQALAKLPDAERTAWRQLWADVDALLKRTADKK